MLGLKMTSMSEGKGVEFKWKRRGRGAPRGPNWKMREWSRATLRKRVGNANSCDPNPTRDNFWSLRGGLQPSKDGNKSLRKCLGPSVRLNLDRISGLLTMQSTGQRLRMFLARKSIRCLPNSIVRLHSCSSSRPRTALSWVGHTRPSI